MYPFQTTMKDTQRLIHAHTPPQDFVSKNQIQYIHFFQKLLCTEYRTERREIFTAVTLVKGLTCFPKNC